MHDLGEYSVREGWVPLPLIAGWLHDTINGGVGERPALWTRERAVVAGMGGFGALFAAGWAMSKVYKRKSGPL